VVWEAACRFTLQIMFCADKVREGTEELRNGEDSVADVVVKRALVEFA
jgi:hypothetical protein